MTVSYSIQEELELIASISYQISEFRNSIGDLPKDKQNLDKLTQNILDYCTNQLSESHSDIAVTLKRIVKQSCEKEDAESAFDELDRSLAEEWERLYNIKCDHWTRLEKIGMEKPDKEVIGNFSITHTLQQIYYKEEILDLKPRSKFILYAFLAKKDHRLTAHEIAQASPNSREERLVPTNVSAINREIKKCTSITTKLIDGDHKHPSTYTMNTNL